MRQGNVNKKLKLIVGLALTLQFTSSYSADLDHDVNPDKKHNQAIENARSGKLDDALAELSALHQQFPDHTGITVDYAIVLTWANRNAEAMRIITTLDPDSIPAYALPPFAKAARNAGEYTKSLALYETLIKRNPNTIDYQIAHALVLIDARQFEQASAEIETLQISHPQNPEVLHAQIYLGQQSGSPIKVLDASQRLLTQNPSDPAVAVTLTTAAREVGATTKSSEIAQQYHLDERVIRHASADIAASQIRWGELEPMDSKKPYVETDKALMTLDSTCQCDWATVDLSEPVKRQLIFDRMLALYQRHRSEEVVMLYNRLSNAHISIPEYAARAAGGAFLELKQPEPALTIYDEILKNNPKQSDVLLDKFSALIELERFDEAIDVANQVAAQEPSYLNRIKNPVLRENDRRLHADTKAVLGLEYGDRLAESDQKFTAMRNLGPENAETKNNLATVWRWRGWLDKAEQSFKANLVEDKDDVEAQFGLANTHLDGRDWKQADNEIQALNRYIAQEDPVMKALNRRWELHNRRELIVDFTSGRSSGSAIGSKSSDVSARLYSSPFNDNYRAFVSTDYAKGNFVEGDGHLFAPNVGLEYRSNQWLASGQVGAITDSDHGISAAANAEYRADDYWRLNGDAQLNSSEVPLRARRAGIDGDSFGLGATYRWSELMQASAVANFLHLSDGNNRESLAARWDRRLYTSPHYKANVRLNLAMSHNSANNTVYFNPEHDTAYSASLLQEWVTWRRYERSFTQKLGLTMGGYAQAGFGNKSAWSVSYSHLWSFDHALEFEYGITHSKQPYDGITETGNSFFGHLDLLF
jgi:biofilm PGA synthesis protein PgaA